jgi:putative glutamine amidotransferase
MATPIVLVPADVKPVDGYVWHSTPSTYLDALVRQAYVTPLILPSYGGEIDLGEVLTRVDGVLVTGSRSNVHPERYGETETARHEPFDPARDATTLPLIRRTIELGIPILCICRGLQELNVALGGTLATEIQESEGNFDHRSPVSESQDERFGLAHAVAIAPGGCLGRIVGDGEVRVNSLHRQAIARLSPQLVVEATATDGTIEAVSVKDAAGFTLGVQWHPEYWAASDTNSARIFAAFGDAVRQRATARIRAVAAE